MTLLKMDSAAQLYFRYQQWPLPLPCIYMAGSGYYAYRMANSFGTLWGKICFFERADNYNKVPRKTHTGDTPPQQIFMGYMLQLTLWCNKISNFQMTECHQPHFHFDVTTMLGTKARKNRQLDIELGCLRELPNLKWHHSTDHGVD